MSEWRSLWKHFSTIYTGFILCFQNRLVKSMNFIKCFHATTFTLCVALLNPNENVHVFHIFLWFLIFSFIVITMQMSCYKQFLPTPYLLNNTSSQFVQLIPKVATLSCEKLGAPCIDREKELSSQRINNRVYFFHRLSATVL